MQHKPIAIGCAAAIVVSCVSLSFEPVEVQAADVKSDIEDWSTFFDLISPVIPDPIDSVIDVLQFSLAVAGMCAEDEPEQLANVINSTDSFPAYYGYRLSQNGDVAYATTVFSFNTANVDSVTFNFAGGASRVVTSSDGSPFALRLSISSGLYRIGTTAGSSAVITTNYLNVNSPYVSNGTFAMSFSFTTTPTLDLWAYYLTPSTGVAGRIGPMVSHSARPSQLPEGVQFFQLPSYTSGDFNSYLKLVYDKWEIDFPDEPFEWDIIPPVGTLLPDGTYVQPMEEESTDSDCCGGCGGDITVQLPDNWLGGGNTLESGQADDVGIDPEEAFGALEQLNFDAVQTESMQAGIGFIWTLFRKLTDSAGIMPFMMLCMLLMLLLWFFGRSV